MVSLALLAFLALVAVASRGHRPFAGGGAGAEEPSTLFWDYLFSISLAVGVIGFGIALWALLTGRGGGKAVPAKRDLKLLGTFFFGAFLLGVFLAVRQLPDKGSSEQQLGGQTLPQFGQPRAQTGSTPVDRAPELQWLPIAAIGIGCLLVLAFFVARRRRRRTTAELTDEQLAAELSALVDDTLDDLRAEPDPRRAVIAAYARMEKVLAASGLPRRHFEAPLEYLDRIASDLHERQASARRLVFELTHLFEQAKFSPHAIDADMKDSAIETLTKLRDDLRAEAAETPR